MKYEYTLRDLKIHLGFHIDENKNFTAMEVTSLLDFVLNCVNLYYKRRISERGDANQTPTH